MKRAIVTTLFAATVSFAACGGSTKTETTTPKAGTGSGSAKSSSSGDPQAMQDTGTPAVATSTPAATGAASAAAGSAAGSAAANTYTPPPEAPVVFPNMDPDPGAAKSQVEQHLSVARAALQAATPDPDTALREAKEALKVDASSLDAAAYVAFAYYHKKQYDTAELILDDLFKRDSAKKSAPVYYVYGLVYDHTNRPEQAKLAFTKAAELSPNFASAVTDVGVHQLQNKQYKEAQETFEKVVNTFRRSDATTLTSLASAYRGHAADYPAGSSERTQLIIQAEATYKKALAQNPNYGPAYYNLALLYLDADPFPSGGGNLDTVARLNAAKTYLDQYQKTPGFDTKLYDERNKDVTKALKRAQKKAGKKGGGTP